MGTLGRRFGLRVLLVEDDEGWADIWRRAVARLDDVEAFAHAASLQAGLAAIETFRPTVVVTDLRLRADGDVDRSGLEICRRACVQRPAIGVVVLTGCATIDVAPELLKMGVDALLDKAAIRWSDMVDEARAAHRRASATRSSEVAQTARSGGAA